MSTFGSFGNLNKNVAIFTCLHCPFEITPALSTANRMLLRKRVINVINEVRRTAVPAGCQLSKRQLMMATASLSSRSSSTFSG